jgi:hypothetical protein
MSSLSKPPDALEIAVKVAAVRALRNRALAQREKAAFGIAKAEPPHSGVIVVSSEARAALNVAADLDDIANELEAEVLR